MYIIDHDHHTVIAYCIHQIFLTWVVPRPPRRAKLHSTNCDYNCWWRGDQLVHALQWAGAPRRRGLTSQRHDGILTSKFQSYDLVINKHYLILIDDRNVIDLMHIYFLFIHHCIYTIIYIYIHIYIHIYI